MNNPCEDIKHTGILYCSDMKCLRKVCDRHPSQVTRGMQQFAWYAGYPDCKERIRMEGDKDNE